MTYSDTIKYPETFKKSPSSQFDSVLDWSWTDGCFGGGKITPMDNDGLARTLNRTESSSTIALIEPLVKAIQELNVRLEVLELK